tara:strand:+ start:1377 stop:2351 length:975 start_codon:yes stop_codon:yes gene_type:complete
MDNISIHNSLIDKKEKLFTEIKNIIIGQDKILEQIFISLLCKGHVLLEGVPGLGKTLIIKTLSEACDLKFSRIQFTPDLMPSDIIGTEMIEEDTASRTRNLKFIKGPIFGNIILADEINRTPPKTQAALLEAMQEYNVTIGGKSYKLDQPFLVLATQNPIEQEGTYSMPEAQLDRFMFNVIIDYPKHAEELEIVNKSTSNENTKISQVLDAETLLKFQELVRNVPVSTNVVKYAVDLVNKTRPSNGDKITNDLILWGAGPRASIFLVLAAKAKALLNGRTTPDINDINLVAKQVLRHRIVINFNAEADGISKDDIIDRLIKLHD